MSEQLDFEREEAEQFRAANQLNFDAEIEEASQPQLTEWQVEKSKELDDLERRIFEHLAAANRYAEKAADLSGTGQERAVQDALNEERYERSQADLLKDERRKLLEPVPLEHRSELDELRKQRGILLEQSPQNPKNKPKGENNNLAA